jgi:hypothetical protein
MIVEWNLLKDKEDQSLMQRIGVITQNFRERISKKFSAVQNGAFQNVSVVIFNNYLKVSKSYVGNSWTVAPGAEAVA